VELRIVTSADRAQHDALTALYSGHHGWLLGWLRKKLGCADQAADLAHDTFVRVIAGRDASSIREPRAYLGTIARSLLVNYWRRLEIERAYLAAVAAQPLASAPSPEERALLLETLCQVDAMLARLPVKVRSAFLLAQIDGLRYAEIAVKLGVSERTIKKYMARAMLQCLTLER
jgi:RNA polymerase sigma factor (sigma-70 family)